MDILAGIAATVFVAILISSLFYYAFNARGPWGSFWTFFLVILLIIWAASLWLRPIGPLFWGIAWIPLFFVGLLFALLLASLPSAHNRREDKRGDMIDEEIPVDRAEANRRQDLNRTTATISGLLWAFMIILLLIILIGYMA